VNRAAIGDLQQPGALVITERPVQRDVPINDSELRLLGVAGSTILSVHSGMAKADLTRSSGHRFRRAYIAIVIEVQEPSEASSRS
jgi:hypothetical protein